MTTADTSAAGLVARIRGRERAATPGPWRWRGNTDTGDPYLTSGGMVVTDGRRHHAGDVLGHIPHEITRAEAERAIGTGDVLVPQVAAEPAGTYATRCEAAASQAYEAALTEYMTGQYGQPRTEQRLAFRHPDAEFVARSREDLAALLDVAERVLAIADRAEHGALRWADPLPVPGWVAEIREAVSGALAGQAGAL
jgi:hypothetical protein